MSPDGQRRGRKIIVSDDLYTVILAVAFCIVVVAAAFVAYKCYFQYDTIFRIP